MNDLIEIKLKILEENRVCELLEYMECEYIKQKSNRVEAQLPVKFNSDNRRSVQVYLNENLSCKIRSRSVSGIDIFGLVSYIVFDIYDENEQLRNIPKAKKWICEKLGYYEFINKEYVRPIKDELFSWLKDIKRERNKKQKNADFECENKTYSNDILNKFIMIPYYPYIQEGIEYDTQKEFQIGFDVYNERIIFPIHNKYGQIISIKGRTIHKDFKKKDIPKYLSYYNYNKSIEIYNWHRAIQYIIENKEVIIFEAEKSCWFATQYGFRNCLAIGGDDLSEKQVQLIKDLGRDIKIVIALDKDKKPKDFVKQAKKFGLTRSVYGIYDKKRILTDEKASPVDEGKEKWLELYNNHKYKII